MDVIYMIDSYLDLKSLRSWRVVNQQALQDVESRITSVLQGSLIVLQSPNLWHGSLWFQFMVNVYTCTHCNSYQQSNSHQQSNSFKHSTCEESNSLATILPLIGDDTIQAEAEGLCLNCYNQRLVFVACGNCNVNITQSSGITCHECYLFLCENCADYIMEMCVDCLDIFCHSCRLGEYCFYCQ